MLREDPGEDDVVGWGGIMPFPESGSVAFFSARGFGHGGPEN
jgi:hypothetical protein